MVKTPSGLVVEIHNMAQFCRDNNLSNKSMSLVMRGKQQKHKGYTKHIEEVK